MVFSSHKKSIFSLLTFFVTFVFSFPELNSKQAVVQYYETNSIKPILHVYFNRHFRKSKQFVDFENVLNQLYEECSDFITIAFTDCEEDSVNTLRSCQEMKKTKDNRVIQATYPFGQFITMGKLLIQSPPYTRVLEHHSDVYTVQELKKMMNGVIPNYYRQLNNIEEYQAFLKPRYSPKIIIFTREDQDELPLVLKQLSVFYFRRFDFALITDLNNDLIPLFPEIKKFPKMMVIKYNFETQQEERIIYDKTSFSENNYEKIKLFLDEFALKQLRNDMLFHKIAIDPNYDITTVETYGQLQQAKQRSSGWMIVARTSANSDVPSQLQEFRNKFKRYYSYVHFRDPNYNEANDYKISFFSPSDKKDYQLYEDGQQLQFNSLNLEDFMSNMTVWLRRDFVVIGVKKQYGYACAISQKTLFRGHTRCLIINDGEDQANLKQNLKLDFEYGFIVRSQLQNVQDDHNDWMDQKQRKANKVKGKKQTKGLKLTSIDFQSTYRQLEFGTRMKLKQVLQQFMDFPINEPQVQQSLHSHCFHPTKKCFILLTDLSKKDRTTQDYLKQLAINYIEGYQFVELDINTNTQALEGFGINQKALKSDLIVFYPRTSQFVRLNKKITKGLIQKFLRANLQNDKRLKRQKLKLDSDQILLLPSRQKSYNEEL